MSALKYLCLVLFAMVGCTDRKTTVFVHASDPQPVALEVEVYDPVTNFVWENVAVRIVEAEVTGEGEKAETARLLNEAVRDNDPERARLLTELTCPCGPERGPLDVNIALEGSSDRSMGPAEEGEPS